MSQEHLFISDVHLGAFDSTTEQKIEQDLITLINYATTNKSKLYILGDLFDYWMEFPGSDFIPKINENVLEAFNRYNQTVSPALFITGNHDNWTINYFEKLGFKVESEYQLIEIFSKKVFCMHGDGLLQENGSLQRPLLHRILRHPWFIKGYQSILSKKAAIVIMKWFSNSTRKLERRNPKPLSENAKFILQNRTAEVVFAGHDHIPRMETFNSGLYINLGTFFHHRTLVRGINNVFSLVQWDAQHQQFKEINSDN